jgi:hypothetical protein
MCALVNPAALFRFRLPCRRRKKLWPPTAWDLDEACRLPALAPVANVPNLLDLWLAWNEEGLAVRAVAVRRMMLTAMAAMRTMWPAVSATFEPGW